MQVFFYRLSDGPVEQALPLLAARVVGLGERLLVLAGDGAQAQAISAALWAHRPEAFLANGMAGGANDARQPVLIAPDCGTDAPANGARYLACADGQWREPPEGTQRVMLLFDEGNIAAARSTWRLLGEREGVERQFWKQEGGRWVQGP